MKVTDEIEVGTGRSGNLQHQKSIEDFEVVYCLSFALRYAEESCSLYAKSSQRDTCSVSNYHVTTHRN